MFKFFKNDIFTNSKVFGIDIGKWFIYWLGKHGITTVDVCCSDGTQTIDEKIATLSTSIDEIEADLPAPLTYKEYEARITQTGTSAPVATVHSNTLSGTPTYSYISPGFYGITLTGEFVSAKTYLYYEIVQDPGLQQGLVKDSVNRIYISPHSGGSLSNNQITDWGIRIRVYN